MRRDFWYLVTQSSKLRPGRTLAATLLGEPLLLGRRASGEVFAFADVCPHRGMPMRHGLFDGQTLQCCYHGWTFGAADGRCTSIPALSAQQPLDPSRFRLRAYPCREVQGNIWVFMSEARDPDPAGLPEVPRLQGFDGAAPQVTAVMRFPCNADLATIGFIDPAHPAFIHTSRWWRSKKARLREKEKHFEPVGLGFRVRPHKLNGAGGNPYRLLGRNVEIELRIELPGLRLEQITGDRYSAAVLAASTPIDADTTDVHYCVYWTVPWMAPMKPFARWMTRDFLRQDYEVAVKLREGGAPTVPPLFVGDADAQIMWFFRLAKEWQNSRAEGRPFVNPLREQALRWRS
ncbi:MAG: aromatic ring-hydroxylating dioxygenase subunit alpha [Methylobacteriaceae bacterium]|nr:aromatic ring-hydroxylating dioxygenase subunit alpha [Methylobacteriaceae bacterium]